MGSKRPTPPPDGTRYPTPEELAGQATSPPPPPLTGGPIRQPWMKTKPMPSARDLADDPMAEVRRTPPVAGYRVHASGHANEFPSNETPQVISYPQERMQLDTGAVRGTDAEATRYDLLPFEAIEAYAAAFAEGAEKYGTHNWLKGFPTSNLLNHAIRHLFLYLRGDQNEDHLGHALWNIGAAKYNEQSRPELVDLPPYPPIAPQ